MTSITEDNPFVVGIPHDAHVIAKWQHEQSESWARLKEQERKAWQRRNKQVDAELQAALAPPPPPRIEPEPHAIAAPAQTAIASEPVGTDGDVNTKPVDRGTVFKRAALIDRHGWQWPTIKRDLQDASGNGLSGVAKASEHGYWFEANALNWARERGKLNETTERTAPTPATPFSGLTHRMKG